MAPSECANLFLWQQSTLEILQFDMIGDWRFSIGLIVHPSLCQTGDLGGKKIACRFWLSGVRATLFPVHPRELLEKPSKRGFTKGAERE